MNVTNNIKTVDIPQLPQTTIIKTTVLQQRTHTTINKNKTISYKVNKNTAQSYLLLNHPTNLNHKPNKNHHKPRLTIHTLNSNNTYSTSNKSSSKKSNLSQSPSAKKTSH